ncbi:hypothetical protein ACLI08_02580 [Flavobacterium sp. RNTU_13]|uniref:hypothetical protein n=1 Tax=Flavobacterium sp. RNTU_13 TaxID=3375145 RepID=UPI00398811EC
MKRTAKQIALTVLLIVIIIIVIFVIQFIFQQLSNYDLYNPLVYNDNWNQAFIVLFHFFVGYYLVNRFGVLKTFKNVYILLVFSLFYLLPYVLIYFLNPSAFHYPLIEISGFISLGIGLWFRHKNSNTAKITAWALAISLSVFTYYIVIPLSSQYNLYRNFTGATNRNISSHVTYLDYNMKSHVISAEDSATFVLDFWDNSCAKCFQRFPLVADFQAEQRGNKQVKILAVNVYETQADIVKAKRLLKMTNNSRLETVFMDKENAALFDVQWFPKVIVLKQHTIIFEGHIEILLLFKRKYLD